MEGSSGLPKSIDWKENTLFENEDKAVEYINKISDDS